MSFKLERELSDVMSEGLKVPCRAMLVLWPIARYAHHEDDPAHKNGLRRAGNTYLEPRCAWITNETLRRAMGNCSDSNRKAAIKDLEKLGLVVRVPYGTDKDGNPVYGTQAGGRAPVYRLPTIEEFREVIKRQREEKDGPGA